MDEAKRLAPEDPDIDEEAQKLIESIDQSILIAAPQTLFASSTPAPANTNNTLSLVS